MRSLWPALLLLGCSGSGGVADGGTDGAVPVSECTGPVEGFCEGSCPSFADSVAEVKQLAGGGRCYIAESGSCGTLRYTSFSSGFFGFVAWFDGAGRLLAGYRFADIPQYCNRTSFDALFGEPPACERRATAHYCSQ